MCLLMHQVAEKFPKLDRWIRNGLPALNDLDRQIDAVTRCSGANREDVSHAFRPEPLSPVVGVSQQPNKRAQAHPTTILRFDIDSDLATLFEARPNDPDIEKLLNAAIAFGIAERLKAPGRAIPAEELETEIFGDVVPDVPLALSGEITNRPFPGTPLTRDDLEQVADTLGLDTAHVWAVFTVEAKAAGFRADRRPLILYERHIFHRLTGGVYDGLPISSPVWGGYNDGPQYDRLAAAMRLAPSEALRSCSWGLGQVMGFNHELTGFDTVENFTAAMIDGEKPQLAAMASFIEAKGLTDHLRNQDWAAFAKGYNGSDYRRNRYDTKLAEAYDAVRSGGMIDFDLRRDQMYLTYLRLKPGPIDGRNGTKTRAAVSAFQRTNTQHGLRETGGRDDATVARLAEAIRDLVARERGDLL